MRWLAAVLSLSLVACGTLPNDHGWGEDASLTPGSGRTAWAAKRAARDPGTWAPALGAVLLAASGADRRLSDWAREERPVFGSKHPAKTSDDLRDYTSTGMFATALMTPSGPPDEFLENKSRGVGIEALAMVTTIGTTNLLKEKVGRTQPNGSGNESFISNHATEPFAHAALIRRNTDQLDLSPAAETSIDTAYYLMAAGSAWSRVELGLHYPSDQLAGAAIGNFIALFFHDAFLGLPGKGLQLSASATPEPSIVLRWNW